MVQKSGSNRWPCVELAGALSLLFLAQSAGAEPEVTHWSAYLRAQPSESAAVIDEIDKDALSLPAPPRGGAPTSPPDCAWAGQAAAHAPEPTQFCHTKSPGP